MTKLSNGGMTRMDKRRRVRCKTNWRENMKIIMRMKREIQREG